MTYALPTGKHQIAFEGRLNKKQRLVAGHYVVIISAAAPGAAAVSHSLRFQIAR